MATKTKIKNAGDRFKWVAMATLAVSALATLGVHADETRTVALAGADQGGNGNRGEVFRPVDENGDAATFVLAARSALDQSQPFDPNAEGLTGTVYLDDKGTGVQGPDGDGSKGMSGHGPWGNEELIATFDEPVRASRILLGLAEIEFDGGRHQDRPVIWLSVAGSGEWGVFLDENDVSDAFIEGGHKEGIVDFSLFNIDPDLQIDAFKIRETDDHILVNQLTVQVASGTPPRRRVVEGRIVRIRKYAVYVKDADDIVVPIHVHHLVPIRRNRAQAVLRDLRIGDFARVRVSKDRDHVRFLLQAMRIKAIGPR